MKPVHWTLHGRIEQGRRGIDSAEVEKTLQFPDAIVPATPPRVVYQRRYFDSARSEEMLLRVFVEETDAELIVVTLYKTSKLAKYTPGDSP
jgi:hypothetical protein